MPAQEVFERSPRNPILSPQDLPFRAVAVLNPGAAEQDGQVVLLVRVEDTNGFSDIYAPRSANGVTDWQIDPQPVLRHGLDEWRYEEWGCEDARVTYVAEDTCWRDNDDSACQETRPSPRFDREHRGRICVGTMNAYYVGREIKGRIHARRSDGRETNRGRAVLARLGTVSTRPV